MGRKVGGGLPGLPEAACGKRQALASEGHLCIEDPPDFVLMCSVVSAAPQGPLFCLSLGAGRSWGRPHPRCNSAAAGTVAHGAEVLSGAVRARPVLLPVFVGGELWALSCGNRVLHSPHMCFLSSGADAKAILPKKEKLKLRRERWLRSKCISCAPSGDVAHS